MGEFQTRIKAFRKNTNQLRVFTEEEATMIQNSIIDLVSIAKKEFETIKSATYGTLTERISVIKEWFERWFGET